MSDVIFLKKATPISILSIAAGLAFAHADVYKEAPPLLSSIAFPPNGRSPSPPSPTNPAPPILPLYGQGWAAQLCNKEHTDLGDDETVGLDCAACALVCLIGGPISCSIFLTACLASPV